MSHPEHNGHAASETEATPEAHEHEEVNGVVNETVAVAATVGVVAVGAALIEVALIPGIALGVAAVVAPKYLPRIGSSLGPVFRSSVRGAYKFGQKTREMMAEAKEQVNDIVAEVKAEDATPKAAGKPEAAEASHA
jgi:hypothetical protein